MMRKLVVLGALALLCACQLPNPYRAPSPPQPVPGGGPSLPAPAPPAQTPPPAEPPPAPAETPPPQPPRSYELGAAARSLVEQAHAQAAGGNYVVAAGSIERALRIEPNNPLLWIELGQVRQSEANYAQAENLGRKALSLATGDPRTQSSAWRLIAQALQGRGRGPEAADAQARADALAPR